MNTTRILHLLKAYFIENKKTMLIFGAIVLGVAAIETFIKPIYPSGTTGFWIAIVLVISATFFQKVQKTGRNTQYFTLPANSFEKLLAGFITIHLLWIFLIFGEIIGYLLGYSAKGITNSFIFPFDLNKDTYDLNMFYIIEGFIPILLFGSIYFKNNSIIKTPLSFLLVGLGSGFLMLLVMFALSGFNFENMEGLNFNMNNLPNWVSYLGGTISILFFYSLTYLRLKETEV